MAVSEVTTLQRAALDRIVTNLGEVASSVARPFCCGSTLSSPDQVNLIYKKSGRNWSSITFPGAKQEDMQQLMSVYSVASFGVGSAEMTDVSNCNALMLQPNRFTISFQLCNSSILDDIQKLMIPDIRGNMQAELCNLNIYSGPGGHFKAHVDTPWSSQMFGSLVVCLPTQFSGGALVTRHQGKEVRFDWSSSPQNPMQKVSWAAFFSDVEHEVLPVTDGYHLTLTYNLYCVDKLQDLPPTADITNSPFYHELRVAVNHPHFLRDGGVLGFRCQHDYVFQDLDSTEDLSCLLKGGDNIVYMSAVSLGLPVVVKPVTGKFFELWGPHKLVCRIMWCQKPTKFQPALAEAAYAYGNDVTCKVTATILVWVPEWGKRQALEVEPQRHACEQAIESRWDIGQQSSNQEGNSSDEGESFDEGESPPAEKRRKAAFPSDMDVDELLMLKMPWMI